MSNVKSSMSNVGSSNTEKGESTGRFASLVYSMGGEIMEGATVPWA